MYPVVVESLSYLDVVYVDAGNYHSVALTGDGSVYTWGWNQYGQLGLGYADTDVHSTPTKVNISDVVAIAVNSNTSFTVALKSDGTVWSWGYNVYGNLGDGTTTDRYSPVKVMDEVKVVVEGSTYVLTLKTDGTVWTWGLNDQGQLGDGTTTQRLTPVQVLNLTNVTKIITGGYHSFALKTDGTMWTWGDNRKGQLGLGDTTNRTTPVQISLSGINEIVGGWQHTIALMNNGTVYTWGRNDQGQLGLGDTTDRYDPTQVPNLSNALAVSAGGRNASDYWGTSFIILADGSLLSFGSNTSSQLGI